MDRLLALVLTVAFSFGFIAQTQAASLDLLTIDASVGKITDDTSGSDAVLGSEVFYDAFFGTFTIDALSASTQAPLEGSAGAFSASIIFDPFTEELDSFFPSTFSLATDRLSGEVIQANFEQDSISFLLDVQGGDLAGTFGDLAILSLSGFSVDASVGPTAFPDPFSVAFGEQANFSIQKAVTTIPLPAGLTLLLSALSLVFAITQVRQIQS